MRAPKIDEMWKLHARVVACAEGAARATECVLKVIDYENAYEPMKRNEALLSVWRANLTTLGVGELPEVKDRLGSSDVGNVSQVVPTIQPLVKIAPDGTAIHSRAFEAAAVTPLAREGLLAAAKAMAMTAVDLLGDAGLLARVKQDFQR